MRPLPAICRSSRVRASQRHSPALDPSPINVTKLQCAELRLAPNLPQLEMKEATTDGLGSGQTRIHRACMPPMLRASNIIR